MDKWKDAELEKMKVGGNRKAQDFFKSQPDYHDGMSIFEKYNSKAAALYRDKVSATLFMAVYRVWAACVSLLIIFSLSVLLANNRTHWCQNTVPCLA